MDHLAALAADPSALLLGFIFVPMAIMVLNGLTVDGPPTHGLARHHPTPLEAEWGCHTTWGKL